YASGGQRRHGVPRGGRRLRRRRDLHRHEHDVSDRRLLVRVERVSRLEQPLQPRRALHRVERGLPGRRQLWRRLLAPGPRGERERERGDHDLHHAIVAKAVSAAEFYGIVALDQTATAIGNSLTPSSGLTAPTTSPNELLYGAIGVETKLNQSFTAGTGYTQLVREQSDPNAGSP